MISIYRSSETLGEKRKLRAARGSGITATTLWLALRAPWRNATHAQACEQASRAARKGLYWFSNCTAPQGWPIFQRENGPQHQAITLTLSDVVRPSFEANRGRVRAAYNINLTGLVPVQHDPRHSRLFIVFRVA